MVRTVFCVASFLLVSLGVLATAEPPKHQVLRRIVVFPMKVDRALGQEPEETWWKLREELTKNRRFLVASRNFLIKKDVFQGRAELSAADAIILGRLLDAQGLIVTFLQGRRLQMIAYEGENGRVLWKQEVRLHPSLPIAQQLRSSTIKLIRDFVASIPYQGFQVVDQLIGKPVYEDDDVSVARVHVGLHSHAKLGDKVQWIELTSVKFTPLFQGGGQLSVIAEGTVKDVEEEVLVVRVDRVSEENPIKKFGLVRLPSEFRRLQEQLALKDDAAKRAGTHLVSSQLNPAQQAPDEHSSLATSITFLANLAAFLLLAF